MDGLSYGFYFIIICVLFLIVYLLFFKDNNPKKNIDGNKDNNNIEQVVNETIKLNQNNISLDIGEIFDLKVTLIPSRGNEIIHYKSSDELIATVDENGKITGISAGSTTVLVTVEGTDIKAECQVDISSNVIAVKELFVSDEKVQLKLGENYKLNVTVIPNNAVDKTLSFSSTNEQILSVNEDGVVTGLKTGNAKIIIQSKSNPNVQIYVAFYVQ